METSLTRLGKALVSARIPLLIVYVGVTAFFFVGVLRLKVRTAFSDLLPEHNSIVRVFKTYENFSSPLDLDILLEVKHGTIFTPDVLRRVLALTRQVDTLPGVNHNTVTSIASSKLRVVRATAEGIVSYPVMPNVPPSTQVGALKVRHNLLATEGVTGILVSRDEKSTLIRAAFHPQWINYSEVFRHVHKMLALEKDPNINYYPAGRVMLVGWVYHYGSQVTWLLLISLTLIAVAVADYFYSSACAITPIAAGVASAIWGAGAGSWLGMGLEPLTLVVPVLLTARALSHSVQITRRYYELCDASGDRLTAAARAFEIMFPPAMLGILCDAAGLYMLLLVPIPLIQQLGLFCGTWSILIIPSVVFATPLLLAVLPQPRDVRAFVKHEAHSLVSRLVIPLRRACSATISERWRVATAIVFVPVAVVMVFLAVNRKVGNQTAGTPLLWSNGEFNRADAAISRELSGGVTLNVVWHSNVPQALASLQAYDSMRGFERRIAAIHGAEAELSIQDFVPKTYRVLKGGNPKWLVLPQSERAVGQMIMLSVQSHGLAALSELATNTMASGDVVLWYKDLRSATVDRAMSAVHQALGPLLRHPPKPFTIELAAGPVALQYALDRVIQTNNARILFYLLAVIFILVAIAYRSLVAASMLLIPLALAQFATDAVMFLRGSGLSINNLPVIAVGLGVGIDYGIYLLNRICDEYQAAVDNDINAAVYRALANTGEAIMFIAFTMVVSLLPWFFLSGLRFLAEMGLMLALVMAFNALLALVLLPLLVVFVKPNFLGTVRLLRH